MRIIAASILRKEVKMARLIRFFILTLVLAEIGSAGWERRADTPQWQYPGSALVFGIENPKTIYAIFGGTKKLYRYLINLDRWDDSPADFPGDVNFGPGAALASDLNGTIYVLVGGGSSSGVTGFQTTAGCDIRIFRFRSVRAVR